MAVYRPHGRRQRSRYQPEYANRVVERTVRPRQDNFDPAKMRILMLSRTPVAGVPFILKDIINKYSPHECKTLTGGAGYKDGRRWGPPDALFGQSGAAIQLLDWAQVVMVHNGHTMSRRNVSELRGKRVLCYYHSEPHRVDRTLERRGAPTYVIAQGHSLLYGGKPVLPNLVDPAHPLMQPDPERNLENGVTVAFSPSNRHSHADMLRRRLPYSAKGGKELDPLFAELRHRGIKVDIHTGVPFEQLMRIRRKAHILLDEVVTGSYHRCTLEACCHAQVPVNAMSPAVAKLVALVGGEAPAPWLVTGLKRMVDDIHSLVSDYDRLPEQMAAARKWIETAWDPQKLLDRWYIPAFRGAKVI